MLKRSLKYIIPLLLITAACYAGVKVFYRLVDQRMTGVETASVEPSEEQPADRKQSTALSEETGSDSATITRRNLFASKDTAAEAAEEIDPLADVEPTSLAIVLMGTVIDAQDDNRAFIYDKRNREQEMYRVGDSIQGAQIRQINSGKVIITMNDRNELLDIAEARKINVPQVKRPAPVTTARRVVGRPTASRVVRPQSSTAAAERFAARARQIRAYRSRTVSAQANAAQNDSGFDEAEPVDESQPQTENGDNAASQTDTGAADERATDEQVAEEQAADEQAP